MHVLIGAELEFYTLLYGDRGPYPFRHAFKSVAKYLIQKGIHFELGPHQVEVCSDVACCGDDLLPSIEARIDILFDLLGDNGYLSTDQYFPQYVVTGSGLLNDPTLSLRHKAILHALRTEEYFRWERVGNLGSAQSVQYHLSLHGVDGTAWSFDPREVTEASEYANTLVNYLNAIAPYYACAVAERYGMLDPTPRIRLWFEYCRSWRAPQYAWHTRESRISWFNNVPRLIGLRDGTSGARESDWEVLPRCGSEPWNMYDAGANRDLVRFSPPRSDKPVWTIEFRPLSALHEVEQVAEVADELIAIVEAVYTHVTKQDVDDVDGLFRALHDKFPFLPSTRPMRREWFRQLGLE